MDAHRIGKRLVALRGARRREEVAKAVGVSFSALCMYETGQAHRPRRGEIAAGGLLRRAGGGYFFRRHVTKRDERREERHDGQGSTWAACAQGRAHRGHARAPCSATGNWRRGSGARLRSLPGGGQRRTSSVEEYVSKIVDLTRELDAQIDEYVDLTRAIEAAIDALEDRAHAAICCAGATWTDWSWERIGRAMGYEQRQVYRLHALALSAFARAWGADDCA